MHFNAFGKAGDYAEPVRKLHPLIFKLRKRRYDLGISSYALGKIMGVSKENIRKWETGVHFPTFHSLIDWCTALKMDIKVEADDDARPTD